MIWWFLILALSTGLVSWVGIAFFLRVRRHMKPDTASKESLEHERGPGGGS
jgi:amino acid permease